MTNEELEKKSKARALDKPKKKTKKAEENDDLQVPAEPVVEVRSEEVKDAPKIEEPVALKAKAPKPAKKPAGLVYLGTGRRKTAVAQVRLVKGGGQILLNGKDFKDYLDGRNLLMILVCKPLEVVKMRDKFDVIAVLRGGGVPSQADAVRMGIARALLSYNPDFKKALRQFGLLTRDSRMKESKKYGHKRARKSFQYSKR